MTQARVKILILGGYGNFGLRLVKSLLAYYNNIEVSIAGRSLGRAVTCKNKLEHDYGTNLEALKIDILTDNLVDLIKSKNFFIVVNACGPFQHQSGESAYSVAKACAKANCHYVDLADDRAFVNGFTKAMDKEANEKQLMMVCGASTVPGLSIAVLNHFQGQFATLYSVNYGVSPGNKTERGRGTVESILSYTGKPIKTRINKKNSTVVGWQDLQLYNFGSPLGHRWMGNCDIPDLDIIPEKFPAIENIRFKAGLEVSMLHLGLWFLSGVSRCGLVKNWAKYTDLLLRLDKYFLNCGSDAGGMFVDMSGIDSKGKDKKIIWQLIAENGVGPNVPTVAAELVIKRILDKDMIVGARPCVDVFTLADFMGIAKRWGIYNTIKER